VNDDVCSIVLESRRQICFFNSCYFEWPETNCPRLS